MENKRGRSHQMSQALAMQQAAMMLMLPCLCQLALASRRKERLGLGDVKIRLRSMCTQDARKTNHQATQTATRVAPSRDERVSTRQNMPCLEASSRCYLVGMNPMLDRLARV